MDRGTTSRRAEDGWQTWAPSPQGSAPFKRWMPRSSVLSRRFADVCSLVSAADIRYEMDWFPFRQSFTVSALKLSVNALPPPSLLHRLLHPVNILAGLRPLSGCPLERGKSQVAAIPARVDPDHGSATVLVHVGPGDYL